MPSLVAFEALHQVQQSQRCSLWLLEKAALLERKVLVTPNNPLQFQLQACSNLFYILLSWNAWGNHQIMFFSFWIFPLEYGTSLEIIVSSDGTPIYRHEPSPNDIQVLFLLVIASWIDSQIIFPCSKQPGIPETPLFYTEVSIYSLMNRYLINLHVKTAKNTFPSTFRREIGWNCKCPSNSFLWVCKRWQLVADMKDFLCLL